MHVHSPFLPTKLAEAPEGTCLLISIQNASYFALVVNFERERALALISPAEWIDPKGKTGIVDGHIAFNIPMWQIPTASAVPASEPQTRAASFHLPIGALIQRHDGFSYVVRISEGSANQFDLATGREVRPSDSPVVWFSQWSLVATGMDGKPLTLRTITAQP